METSKWSEIVIVSDPLIVDYGPTRPVVLLARELRKSFDVAVVSSYISEGMMRKLESFGVEGISLELKTRLKDPSLSFFECWLKEAAFAFNSRKWKWGNDLILNFSNTIAVPSVIWYLQAPVSVALRNIRDALAWHFRVTLLVLGFFIEALDRKIVRKMQRLSRILIANSRYSSECYSALGIKVNRIIYPPLDCNAFKPTCQKPSADYVLAYLGKEIDFQALRRVADAGVKIKAFGGKFTKLPASILKHPNIEVLGWLDHNSLVDAYSNALFTLFPFTEEPFGYIPVESMACGTPVLTYDKQGPAETVINGVTGWLADTIIKLIKKAIQLWRAREVSEDMRKKCRSRALEYDAPKIASKWYQKFGHS